MILEELLKAREELKIRLLKCYTEEVKKFEKETGAIVTDITMNYIISTDMMGRTDFSLGDVDCEIKYQGVRIGG